MFPLVHQLLFMTDNLINFLNFHLQALIKLLLSPLFNLAERGRWNMGVKWDIGMIGFASTDRTRPCLESAFCCLTSYYQRRWLILILSWLRPATCNITVNWGKLIMTWVSHLLLLSMILFACIHHSPFLLVIFIVCVWSVMIQCALCIVSHSAIYGTATRGNSRVNLAFVCVT